MVVTADELQAAARLAGTALPPTLAAGDADRPRVDLAALRGLAVRGLLRGLGSGRAEPAGPLAAALDVLAHPVVVVEVEQDTGGTPPTAPGRWSLVAGATSAVRLTVRPAGLVDVDEVDGDPADAVVAGCRLDEVGDEPPAGAPWEADAAAHAEADERALAGDRAGAASVLARAGVDAEAAAAWAAAVHGRRSATALRVARLLPGGAVEIRDVRWLVDGSGGAWLVEAGGGPADERDGGCTSVVRPVDASGLRAAVREVTPCWVDW